LKDAAAVACCAISAFSAVNGLATWIAFAPAVFGTAVRGSGVDRRRPVWRMALWAASFAVVCFVYFWHYKIGLTFTRITMPWESPLVFARYVLVYLGAGFLAGLNEIMPGKVFIHSLAGMVLCVIFITGWLRGYWRGAHKKVMLGLILFVFMTALLTATGRISWGIETALLTRYRLYSALFPVLMLGMLVSGPAVKSKLGAWMAGFLLLGIVLGTATGWYAGIRQGVHWKAIQERNAKILVSYATARDDELARVFRIRDPSRPQSVVRSGVAVLEKLRYNVFSVHP